MIDGRRPIHYAADYGQKEIIEYLIQRGSDVNVRFLSDNSCQEFLEHLPTDFLNNLGTGQARH